MLPALPCLQVFEALRELGLHSTAAGRQAVVAAHPARNLRADTLTSGQKQGLHPRGGLGAYLLERVHPAQRRQQAGVGGGGRSAGLTRTIARDL